MNGARSIPLSLQNGCHLQACLSYRISPATRCGEEVTVGDGLGRRKARRRGQFRALAVWNARSAFRLEPAAENEIVVRNPVCSRPVSASILSDEEGRGAQELPRQEWLA
jgi:hypothetical protein